MCGIAGIVNLDKSLFEKSLLEEMVRMQRHRGPDDRGLYIEKNIGLGHTRLSIIDLSKDAHQPMSNEDNTAFIIHNGEIYNYLELRQELVNLGHNFKSRSDTEVILHAYEEWGEDCLKRFNGMWAFAILDSRKKILFCSRDRLGVKPFYYHLTDEVFIFASEIKAILAHPKIKRKANDQSIFTYLCSGYGYMDTSDDTFFEGIKQVKPGHYIILSIEDKKFSQKQYWNLEPRNRCGLAGEKEICEKFYNLFTDSIKLRLRSDVPVGVSLSGGLDSSSIACITAALLKGNRLEAFSSCFDEEEADERRFIRPVLEKTKANANLIFTKSGDLFNEIENIIWHQEEPYSTLSIFPQWYVMKLAKEKGVKVLLTGQGGDEVLAGYDKYYFYLFADLIYSLKLNAAFKEMGLYRSSKRGIDGIFASTAKIIFSHITPQSLKNFLNYHVRRDAPSYLNRDFASNHVNRIFNERRFVGILNNDLYNALKISPLPSLLHIDDRSSMAHSVESRSPFLDYRLVEYLFSIGPEYKIRGGVTKYILRKSLKGILPEEVRNRRDKMGFATPLERWFRTNLKDSVYGIINSKEFLSRPYFNHQGVLRTFESFLEGKEKNSHYTIWSWVNLELWLRKFMDERHEI